MHRTRPEQPLPIRLTHWLNVPVLLFLAMSGLQILAAFPSLGPKGAAYLWYPFEPVFGHADHGGFRDEPSDTLEHLPAE